MRKYQNNRVKKYQTGDAPAFGIDSELLKAGIAGTESSGGVNMMNPGSTATGLYGQLFSEIRGSYPRTRKEFSTNIAAQDSIFDKRLYEGLNNERSLMDNVQHMYETYPEQIAEKGYNAEQVAGIINMLGRQGTREYLGYVVRDGKDLGEVFPNLYGDNVKVKNKTPDQYAETMQDWMDRYAEDNCPGGVCEQVTERKTGGNAFERFSNALKSRKKDAPKQSNIFRSYTIEKPKEESPSGKRLDRKSWASLSAKMSYKTGGVTKYQQGGPRKLVEVNGELVSVGLNATDEEIQTAYEEQYAPKPEPAPQPKQEQPRPQPRSQPQPQPQPRTRPTPEPPAKQPEPAPAPARDTIPVENSEEGPTINVPFLDNPDFGVPTTPPEEVAEELAWYEGVSNYLGDVLDAAGNKISDNIAFLQDGIMRNKDLSEEFDFLPEGSNLGVLRGLTDFIGFTIAEDEVGEFNLENEDVFRDPDGPAVPPEAYPIVYGTTADGKKYLTNFQQRYLDNDRDYPGGESRNFWAYRNQYLNEDGFQFTPFTHKQGLERSNQDGIEGIQGVGHFLIDADPTKPKTEQEAVKYLSRLDQGAYVPVFKTEENGRITLKYVNSRDQYEEMNANGEWSPLANLRQFKASDVAWDVNDTPFGNQHNRSWDRGITNYKLKDGTDTYIPWKRHKGPDGKLGRFNGATVTYLFTDPQSGKLVVRDFTGKAQEIRDEVGKIQKRFGISDEDITIGFYDAGSYSAKPVANSEGFVSLDQYRTFNTQETSGAGLGVPADYRPSPDLIFDSNAWKTGGAASISKYFNRKLKRK